MSGGGERIPGMCGEEQETTGEDVSHPPGGGLWSSAWNPADQQDYQGHHILRMESFSKLYCVLNCESITYRVHVSV